MLMQASTTALVKVSSGFYITESKGQFSALTLIDLSVASNIVDHSLLGGCSTFVFQDTTERFPPLILAGLF